MDWPAPAVIAFEALQHYKVILWQNLVQKTDPDGGIHQSWLGVIHRVFAWTFGDRP
jgi:hypothetical protein